MYPHTITPLTSSPPSHHYPLTSLPPPHHHIITPPPSHHYPPPSHHYPPPSHHYHITNPPSHHYPPPSHHYPPPSHHYLSLSAAALRSYRNDHFGAGENIPLLLAYPYCNGREAQLANCSGIRYQSRIPSYCSAVGIECLGECP